MRAAIYRLGIPYNNIPVVEYAEGEARYDDHDSILKRIDQLEHHSDHRINGIPQWLVCIDCRETLLVRNGKFQ